MTEPALDQDPEGISPRAIWIVAAAVVAISAGLIAVAWLLVAPPPPPSRPPAARSPLERGLIERADGGDAIRAAGAARIERAEWIDRAAGVARIPIARAIDAVAADPRLIAAPPGSGSAAPSPSVGAVGAVFPTTVLR